LTYRTALRRAHARIRHQQHEIAAWQAREAHARDSLGAAIDRELCLGAAMRKVSAQLDSQLSGGSKNNDSSGQGPILPVHLKSCETDCGEHEDEDEAGPRQPGQTHGGGQCWRLGV